jgi:hypothetical protein
MTRRSLAPVLAAAGALFAAGPAQAAQVADAKCDGGSNTSFSRAGQVSWAQTFTAQNTGPLTKARFRAGTFGDHEFEVSIYNATAGGAPTTSLGTEAIGLPHQSQYPIEDPSAGAVDVAFDPPVQVTAGQPYALVVKKVSGSGFALVGAYGDPCAGAAFYDDGSDGTWTPAVFTPGDGTPGDLVFAVFVGTPDNPPPPNPGGGGNNDPPPRDPTPDPPPTIVQLSGASLFFLNGQTMQIVTTVSSAGTVTTTVYGPAPSAAAAKKRKRFVAAKKTFKVKKAGKVKLKLPIKKAARKAIKRNGKFKGTLHVKFTPAGGGKPDTAKKSITLKPKPKKK